MDIQVKHPATLADTENKEPAALSETVTVGGVDYTVDTDAGTVTCPKVAARTLALRWGVALSRIDTERAVCGYDGDDMADGPCEQPAGWGRDDVDTGPCTYHYDGDNGE